ncbi:MAG: MFS transporter [Spirochaetes bacterium]|nr:MFS transporter [Spirochaetota bacterium]
MAVVHASPIAQELLGLTPEAAGFVVGFFVVGMALGKVLWGAVSDKTGRYPVFFTLFLISATAMSAMSCTTDYAPFVVSVSIAGLCYGGFLSLIAPVTADSFGQKYLGINFGIMFLSIAIAGLIGPVIGAVMKDTNNDDYAQAFLFGGIINIIGVVLVAVFMMYMKLKK